MLRYRLLFGTLMIIGFVAIVVFDGWLDGSLTKSLADDKPVQGVLFSILVAVLAIPAQIELSKLAAAKKLKIFLPVAIVASVLFATQRFWQQFADPLLGMDVVLLSSFVLFALVLYQYVTYRTSGVLANCGANCFAIWYLGLLSGFCVAIRIEFGTWPLLLFVFVIKSADIGAYTFGKLFGRHKFSPKVSPGKTWEGMGGAFVVAVLVAVGFAISCGIMAWQSAVLFGLCFAVVGQLGDLTESMIKRDAEQKDSAHRVPGFGGVLDIIDSLLIAAPVAYLFLKWTLVRG
ncbi:MAG: phosphatidate cytidylyltransferase [Sedimentisphaerales bacterium]